MASIKNLGNLTPTQIESEIRNGGSFRVFSYTVSIVVMTFNPKTDIHFIKAGENTAKYSIGYTLLTLILGWWGFPWGPIYTIGSLFSNLSGGKDVTAEVMNSISNQAMANTSGYSVPNPNATTQGASGYNVPSGTSGYNVPSAGGNSAGSSPYNVN